MRVNVKRVYEEPSRDDGERVLVDRLWPRGLRKEEARVDHWLRDLAPSNDLRKWYHSTDNWVQFKKRYFQELCAPEASAALETLYNLLGSHAQLTLLYSSRNTERNNAVALKELLDGMKK